MMDNGVYDAVYPYDPRGALPRYRPERRAAGYVHPYYPYVQFGSFGYAYAPWGEYRQEIKDYGPNPFVVNIEEAAKRNGTYRTALWTGKHLQVTLMSIGVGEDIGLEVHPKTDQFIRVEDGQGFVQMGDGQDRLNFAANVYDGYAIVIPAGKWHNVTNTGDRPLKLYSLYAPPNHPFGTVQETKAEAMASE